MNACGKSILKGLQVGTISLLSVRDGFITFKGSQNGTRKLHTADRFRDNLARIW